MILLHRLAQSSAAGMSGTSIGCTKWLDSMTTLQNGLPLGVQT